MKLFILCLVCLVTTTVRAQTAKPAYCQEGFNTYGSVMGVDDAAAAPAALPAFASLPTKEFKVQVAILRHTDPTEYPFHSSLIARFRPCEEVWVIESRESFADRADAVDLQNDLKEVGYDKAFITELIGYQ